jgi:hypothetical protein
MIRGYYLRIEERVRGRAELPTAETRRPAGSGYWCVPQSMKRGLPLPVVRRRRFPPSRSMTARL